LSLGLIIAGDSPNENIQTLDFISPAICYGYRKYINSRNIEKHYDLQVTVFSDIYDSPALGLGIGKIKYANYSNLRVKAYTWALVTANVDIDLITRKTNLSIIPVIPIGNY